MTNGWINKNVASMLAIVSVLGGLVLLYLFATVKVDSANEKIVLIIIGILSGVLTQVTSYYFGSSSGSAKKDDTMGKALLNGSKPTPEHPTPQPLAAPPPGGQS